MQRCPYAAIYLRPTAIPWPVSVHREIRRLKIGLSQIGSQCILRTHVVTLRARMEDITAILAVAHDHALVGDAIHALQL
jgi:hypothetical protein